MLNILLLLRPRESTIIKRNLLTIIDVARSRKFHSEHTIVAIRSYGSQPTEIVYEIVRSRIATINNKYSQLEWNPVVDPTKSIKK